MHSQGNGSPSLGKLSLAVALLFVLAACGRDSADVIGQAYVAPEKLNLRRDLLQKNSAVAVLRHGQPVDVIDVRRRFVEVRTRQGQEGWLDSLQLLSKEQMDQIKHDDEEWLRLPPEGKATAFDATNLHIDPSRQSPAFAKIPEGGSVTVLAHRLEPRVTEPPKPPSFERPVPERRSRKEKTKNSILPPPPPPPKPPANWLALSAEKIDGAESTAEMAARKQKEAAERKAAAQSKPVVLENWTLVRTSDNQVGWVLSRSLEMSIPDDVAQYAEGKRITSYFDLGAVQDEDKGLRHNWLWTTESSQEPYDFDGWRVFLWNRRRHRYETSYREPKRREDPLQGFFPVHVDPADASTPSRTFELITRDSDGKLRERKYEFDGQRVHLVATQDYNAGANGASARASGIDTDKLHSKMPRDGFFKRAWNSMKRRLGM